MRLKLYKPHDGQKPLHGSNARFRIACTGRRFGKTYLAINEIIKYAWEHPNKICWWIAPSYAQCRIPFRIMSQKFKDAIQDKTKQPMEIYLKSGGIIQFKSASESDSLRGEGVFFMVIDEASIISQDAWEQALRPTLSDTDGKAIIISTPNGVGNWFHKLWIRGQDESYDEYESWSFPTSANPYIRSEEIEEVKQTLPHDVFKQEYEAEFLDQGGSVFRNIRQCVKGELHDPEDKEVFQAAWDVAKHSDFSCLVILRCSDKHLVYFDRFNKMDYTIQLERICHAIKRYNNARLLMDSTGVGDPLLEQVKRRGVRVEGYNFTNTSKQQLIEHLAVMMERQAVTFPDIPVLINELSSYKYEITRAGNVRYNAPSGLHDDSVIALALAVWGVRHKRELKILSL